MEKDGVPGPVWPSGIEAGEASGLRRHYVMTYVKRYVIPRLLLCITLPSHLDG
jgi:hypothetical protein